MNDQEAHDFYANPANRRLTGIPQKRKMDRTKILAKIADEYMANGTWPDHLPEGCKALRAQVWPDHTYPAPEVRFTVEYDDQTIVTTRPLHPQKKIDGPD